MPFDKGSGTTVPQWAWDSVACVSVLLLFAVGPPMLRCSLFSCDSSDRRDRLDWVSEAEAKRQAFLPVACFTKACMLGEILPSRRQVN